MLDEMLETYDEYDESDFESDFEDLEFDEARRRRRNRRRPSRRRVPTTGPAWRRQPPPTPGGGSRTAEQLKREAEAGRARDKQLAREVNSTKEDVSDVAAQLKKVNADLVALRQISMISMLLPRSLDIKQEKVAFVDKVEVQKAPFPPGSTEPNALSYVTNITPTTKEANVVSGVSSKLDILPVILFMMMGKGIGKPGKVSGGGLMGDNSMMLVVLLLLMQQQQAGTSGQPAAGGLDTTTLLLIMMAAGGL